MLSSASRPLVRAMVWGSRLPPSCPVLWVLFLGFAGCSGSQQAVNIYRADLGRAPSRALLVDVVANVLQNYGYQPRQISGDRLDTEWRMLTPVAGEHTPEVVRVRDRARIIISQRGRDFYVARMTIDNEVFSTGRWHGQPPSEAMRDQYKDIENEIRSQLKQYMTQH